VVGFLQSAAPAYEPLELFDRVDPHQGLVGYFNHWYCKFSAFKQ